MSYAKFPETCQKWVEGEVQPCPRCKSLFHSYFKTDRGSDVFMGEIVPTVSFTRTWRCDKCGCRKFFEDVQVARR